MQNNTLAILVLILTGLMQPGCQKHLERVEIERPLMGTGFRIIAYGENVREVTEACDAAFRRMEELDAVLSDYRSDSEIVRLSRTSGSGEAVPVGPDLWPLLVVSRQWSETTNGAFDITVGPMVRLWRQARHDRRLPRSIQMEQAHAATGFEKMILNAGDRTCRLTAPGMRLDVGAIAKGYAADEALKLLSARGFDRVLIDAGGDIRVGAAPPGKAGWSVTLQPGGGATRPGEQPQVILLSRAGVATSGDAFRFVEIDGKHYSHIVDTRSGLGLTTRMGVSVTAHNGTTADALATAVSVLGVEKGFALVDRIPGAAAMAGTLQGDGSLKIRFSSRAKDWKWAEKPGNEKLQ